MNNVFNLTTYLTRPALIPHMCANGTSVFEALGRKKSTCYEPDDISTWPRAGTRCGQPQGVRISSRHAEFKSMSVMPSSHPTYGRRILSTPQVNQETRCNSTAIILELETTTQIAAISCCQALCALLTGRPALVAVVTDKQIVNTTQGSTHSPAFLLSLVQNWRCPGSQVLYIARAHHYRPPNDHLRTCHVVRPAPLAPENDGKYWRNKRGGRNTVRGPYNRIGSMAQGLTKSWK